MSIKSVAKIAFEQPPYLGDFDTMMPSENAEPPEQPTVPVPQIIMAIHSDAGNCRNTVDTVPGHGLQAILEVPKLLCTNRAALLLALGNPESPGAGDIQSIEEACQPRGQTIRDNYDMLLATNTPSSVKALGEPQNRAKVKQVRRIIVLLNLNRSGTSYLGQAAAYWEDYAAGPRGYEAMYSEYLAYETVEEEEEVRDLPGFIGSLLGDYLCTELIQLQDNILGTKELTFITIRGPRDKGYNPTGRFTVSPHADSYSSGTRDGDILLKCIKKLANLQRQGVPLRIIMEGTLPECDRVASFITRETGLPVQVEGLVRDEA